MVFKAISRKLIRTAFRDSLPVMAGYLVLGFGFGMILKSKGLGTGWAFLTSAFIYAGSMQFVLISLVSEGASLLTIAVSTLLVNARHLFYGISMIGRYRNAGSVKPYLVFSLTDETFSLVSTDRHDLEQSEKTAYCFLVSVMDQIYWITGSVLGAFAGSLLRINTTGMDFALTALFLTIVIDQWRGGRHHVSTVLGFLISVVCLAIFGTDGFLIPAMILITASLFLVRRKEEPHA